MIALKLPALPAELFAVSDELTAAMRRLSEVIPKVIGDTSGIAAAMASASAATELISRQCEALSQAFEASDE